MTRQKSFGDAMPRIDVDDNLAAAPGFRIAQARFQEATSITATGMQAQEIVDLKMVIASMQHHHAHGLTQTTDAQQHGIGRTDQLLEVRIRTVSIAPLLKSGFVGGRTIPPHHHCLFETAQIWNMFGCGALNHQ